jgi:hypothetical protein
MAVEIADVAELAACPTNQSPPLKPFGKSGDRESGGSKDRIAEGVR